MPTAQTLVAYYQAHGRLPRQTGFDDATEKEAGNILRVLRRRAAGETGKDIEPEMRAFLDEHVPGWLTDNVRPAARGMRGRTSFEARVRALHLFRAKNPTSWPSARSADVKEVRLAVWLRNQRSAAKGKGTAALTLQRRLRLDRTVPGWDLQPVVALYA